MSLLALFVTAFLAGTVLPLGSEALLLAMTTGPWSLAALWGVATLGNGFGGLTCYGLGRLGDLGRLTRWLRMGPEQAQRQLGRARRYGAWAGLLCWLPGVGDPLAVALGLARTPWVATTLLIFLGKGLRYAALLALVEK